MARYVVSQTADRAYHGTGSAASRRRSRLRLDRRSVSELRDEETQREFLTDRVEAMIAEIAGRLRERASSRRRMPRRRSTATRTS